MPLKAYWAGRSIVAAYDPAEVLEVMERHEPADKYLLEEVRELTEVELQRPVAARDPELVHEALSRCLEAQLIRWNYPRQ